MRLLQNPCLESIEKKGFFNALKIRSIAIVTASIVFISVFIPFPLFAQVERIEKIEREIEKEKALREKIEKEKEKPKIEEKKPTEVTPPPVAEKMLIQKINVVGATLISEKEISGIIAPFENKELTVAEMQKVADLITDAYRKKGYVTSRAYLPPQNIEKGVLEIRVIEGITGDVEIRGNRFFKATLFKKKITLKKGQPFNYDILRRGLSRINEHPDRSTKGILVPGKEPGATDIVLEVKDNLPVHLGFNYDNYGSRYIDENRYKATLMHNNLLGWDDKLALQYQLAEAENYVLTSSRYLLPVTEGLQIGFFATRTTLRLGEAYEDLRARGKSRLYGIYATQALYNAENVALSLNAGFDYKDIFNFQLGDETSRDRLRVAKVGLDLDLTDRFGRTLISNEFDYGIPKIMGGLEEDVDSHASRIGAGAKFTKDNLSLIRLQRAPFGSTLLWKNQAQFTPYILTAAEQFQIGGVTNVRGYPSAELVGDKGYSSTLEWSFPPYFIPRGIKVPLSKAKFYDALKLVAFYDWANARLRSPQPGEEENRTLRAVGCGVRFNLPEDFSLRADFGWPLDNEPSDNQNLHTWTEITKIF